MTRGRFTVLLLAVALALGLSGFAARRWSSSGAASACSAAAPRSLGAAVPVQEGLVVAERGFSRADGWSFSAGALVANRSSRWAAYRTSVGLRLLDASGSVVVALPERRLPLVLPGARLPVGVAVDVPPDRASSVAGFEVTLSTTHWVPVEPGNALFRRFDALPDPDGDFLLPANLGAEPCEGLSPTGAALVYRNASGTVIGGESVPYSGEYCAGSHAGDRLPARHVPDTTDLPRTQMAVYCDVAL